MWLRGSFCLPANANARARPSKADAEAPLSRAPARQLPHFTSDHQGRPDELGKSDSRRQFIAVRLGRLRVERKIINLSSLAAANKLEPGRPADAAPQRVCQVGAGRAQLGACRAH